LHDVHGFSFATGLLGATALKTGTLDKMKFMVFQNLIKAPRFAAIGLLEGLWYMTAVNAPSGDIGRFSDLEIAAWLGWPDQASDLIAAYVTAGFLDRCSVNRLVVHDWNEHCPNHVSNNLKRWNKDFVQPSPGAPDDPKEHPKDDPIGASYRTLLPNLTKPNQTQSSPTEPNQTDSVSPSGDGYPVDFDSFWKAYPKRTGKKRGKEKAFRLWKASVLAADRQTIIEAATNYANSDEAKRDFARDAERFLAADWWRDWITPAEPQEQPLDRPQCVEGDEFDYLSYSAAFDRQ
jgi:hypothetical protein